MRRSTMVLAATIAFTVTACGGQAIRESGGEIDMSSAAGGGSTWGSTFRGNDGWNSLRGSAFARPNEGGTQIALTIEGGIAGSQYAWDVREGTCGSAGAVVGQAVSYVPVPLGNRGMGSSVADLMLTLDPGKQYVVNVYTSASDRTGVIACGMLSR